MAPVLRLEALLRDAANDDIRPVNGSERIWQVGDPPLFCRDRAGRQHRVDTLKRQVVVAFAHTAGAAIYHAESPVEASLPGTWIRPADGFGWTIPADIDLSDLAVADWLFASGNWTISSHPLGRIPPDLFRRDVANALEWLKQSGAHAVVDSWHDDRQWIVALIR